VSFFYKANDGEADSNVSKVTITINGVNDAPTSTNDSVTTNEDTAKILVLTDFGVYNDVDGDVIAAVKITALESNGSLEYDTTGGGAWATVTLNQEISAAHIAGGRLRFVPDANENGTPYATVGYQVGDGTDFSASSYTLTVNVTAQNDNPVAVNDVLWVSNTTTVTLSLAALLGNDTDLDGLAVSITGFSAAAGQFTTNPTLNGDGTFSFTTNATGGTVAAPTARTFSYTLTDGAGGTATGTVTVNVITMEVGATDQDTVNLSGVGAYQGAYIDGKTQADALTGGAGYSVMIGGAGNDVLNGGSGNDILRGGAGGDDMNGDTGIDLVDFSDAGSGINLTLVQSGIFTSVGNAVTGLGNDDYMNMEGIIGSATGNDTLTGSGSSDVLWGLGGTDTLNGGGGDDTLRGGAANDSIAGGAGTGDLIDFSDATGAINFTLAAGGSGSFAAAGLGTDTYSGIEGMIGSGFSDTLSGSTGNDILVGGSGADTMSGGTGADTFRFLNSDAPALDSITDFDTAAPALGDMLDIADVLDSAGNTWVDGSSVAVAEAGGYISFVNNGGNIQVNVDIDGSAGTTYAATSVAVLTSVAFTDAASALGLLTDNIKVD
jgi:hypothetical protein